MTAVYDLVVATEPAEERGLERDDVRMLVAGPDHVQHAHARDLAAVLRPGDLLVVNTSATLPGAVDGLGEDGRAIVLHFSTGLDDGRWVVEIRRPDGLGPYLDGEVGEHLVMRDGVRVVLESPYSSSSAGTRLWVARVLLEGPVEHYLAEVGRPITYGHNGARFPLSAYQTVFAREPGSAEMPSAGRAFTHRLVTELVLAGVQMAPVVLHCGVSSLEIGEPPMAERFRVPPQTARLVARTRADGGRVVAVGTTVTRALESAAALDGSVHAASGRTDLVLGPGRPARVVDGLLTGWHEPGASHLMLLEAVSGAELVRSAYDEARSEGYLWHEFGDVCLLLPR